MENEEELVEEANTDKLPHIVVLTETEKSQLRSAEKNVIAGGIAGSFGKTVTAPLSRLTVLYQVGPLLKQHAHLSGGTQIKIEDSLWQTVRSIVRREGLFSLWKGNFTAVIHRFPFSAINFASFEALKSFQFPYIERDSVVHRVICGGCAGAIACFACYPLDLARVRLTVGTGSNTPTERKSRLTSKIVDTLAPIIEKEGVRGLYSGLGVTLLVAVPNYALSFGVYGQVKEYLLKNHAMFTNKKTGHLTPTGSLLSGSVSGIFCSCVLFPVDVIRKRMQVMGSTKSASSDNPGVQQRKGFFDHAKAILKNDGVRGFYRGLAPELLKVCPMVAITFCTYEMSKDLLDQMFP